MSARAVALAIVGAAGCGRLGFDASTATDASADNDAAAVDDAALADDAPALDDAPSEPPPDAFVAVCGDGVCSADGGESCLACGGDCNTRQPVCGNQVCDAGETSASCFDDCGPSPWPAAWATVEDDIRTMINNARASGGCGNPPAPALVPDDGLRAVARNQSWDAAHHDYSHGTAGGARCNGVTVFELMTTAGYPAPRGYVAHSGGATAMAAVSSWLGDATTCDLLLGTDYSRFGIGHAEEMHGNQLIVWNYVLLWEP